MAQECNVLTVTFNIFDGYFNADQQSLLRLKVLVYNIAYYDCELITATFAVLQTCDTEGKTLGFWECITTKCYNAQCDVS